MSDTVAGKIRIDLLTNAAQFKAGMREAGRDGFGSFNEEAQKFNSRFDGKKEAQKRAEKEGEAWRSAVTEYRDKWAKGNSLQGSGNKKWWDLDNLGDAAGTGGDKALQRSVRMKGYLPWGMSMRTEMSKEAAATAAAIGDHKQTLVKRLADASAGFKGGGGIMGAIGNVGSVAKGILTNPVTAVGSGIAAYGALAHQEYSRKNELARNVSAESKWMGTDARDTSKLMNAGIDSDSTMKLYRSLASGSKEVKESLTSMGLSLDKIKGQSLTEQIGSIADGFNKIHNPIDRADAVMTLFGKDAKEMIPVLEKFREKMADTPSDKLVSNQDVAEVKALDSAWKNLGNAVSSVKAAAVEETLRPMRDASTGLARFGENLILAAKGDKKGLDKAVMRQAKEDYAIDNADKIAADEAKQRKRDEEERQRKIEAKRQQETRTFGEGQLTSMGYQALAASKGQAAAEKERYRQDLIARGADKMPGSYAFQGRRVSMLEEMMDRYDQGAARVKRGQQDADLKGYRDQSLSAGRGPLGIYQEEMKKLAELKDRKLVDEAQYATIRKKNLEDYFRAEFGLDRKKAAEELRSPAERYQREMDAWRAMKQQMGGDGANLSVGGGIEGLAQRKLQSALGVKSPMTDFKRQFAELKEARDNNLITDEQYQLRRKELRRTAVEGAMAFAPEAVAPVGAMARGSAAAYSMLVQSQLNDPRTALQEQANQQLEAIEKNTRPKPSVTEENVLDF